MIDAAQSLALEIGLLAIFGLFGALFMRASFNARWFLAALALHIVYNLALTRGLWQLPEIIPDANWNWTGKLASFALMLAIASLPVLGWKRVGLTLDQGEHWRAPLVLLIVLSALFVFGAYATRTAPDPFETIAFQWTMPGLDEELFYRGVLLLALNEAFRPRVNVLGASISYGGLLSSAAFGFAHTASMKDGAASFDAMAMIVTAIPALLLLWMRERTGSLVMPIIGHNVANGADTLI